MPLTHRRGHHKFDTEEIRGLHRVNLTREARSEGELVVKMKVAINQTKGHPWTDGIERNDREDNIEIWILK